MTQKTKCSKCQRTSAVVDLVSACPFCDKPMTYTEKLIDEMVRDFCSVIPKSKSEVRQRISEAIHQAEQEMMKRVVGEIKEAWNYPCNCDRKNIQCIHDFSQMRVALSSLEINNPK